jgi:hypothetical protein
MTPQALPCAAGGADHVPAARAALQPASGRIIGAIGVTAR